MTQAASRELVRLNPIVPFPSMDRVALPRLLPALILCTAMLGVGCGDPKTDLDAICALVTDVQADKKLSKKEKSVRIVKNIRSVVSTSEVRDLIKSVSNKSKGKRYKALVSGAKKLGVSGYKCKAAKKWLRTM